MFDVNVQLSNATEPPLDTLIAPVLLPVFPAKVQSVNVADELDITFTAPAVLVPSLFTNDTRSAVSLPLLTNCALLPK